jgi:hypothetical protein
LAKTATDDQALEECLAHLESYIVRRDICRLTTKNYNNVFIDIMKGLDPSAEDLADNLANLLKEGDRETNLWPDDKLFEHKWVTEKQYRTGRQKRLVYILTRIEQELASDFSEGIVYKTELSVEHIMPQSWADHWPLEALESPDDEFGLDEAMLIVDRDSAVNTFGNLTLLTQKLNSSVSNGPFDNKLNAINSHSRLTLNLELQDFEEWDESSITSRARKHAQLAKLIWKRS